MARIRTMKPDFFTHPEVVAVSIPSRLLLLSLLTQADDEGRLYLQPRKIAGLAFGENDRVKVDRLLEELIAAERICNYTVGGKGCLHIPKFREHQVINRPTSSRIPPCPVHDDSPTTHGVLSESSQPEVEVEVEVEVEQGSGKGKGEVQDQKTRRAASPFGIDDHQQGLLVRLWERHPGWEGKLTHGGLVGLMKQHGPRAVNIALEELGDVDDDVANPYGWLSKVAAEHA